MRASIRNIVTTSRFGRERRQDPLHHHELLEALDLGVAGGRQVQLAHAADRQQRSRRNRPSINGSAAARTCAQNRRVAGVTAPMNGARRW
jgi:hypothetical protein